MAKTYATALKDALDEAPAASCLSRSEIDKGIAAIAALEAENVRLRAAMSRLLEGLDKHDVHDYCEALQQARQALARHPAEASEQHPDASHPAA